jgi:hypothetical protein
MQIDLVSGLENHTDKILFMVGECDRLIGRDYQKGHMKYFPDAEMAVIRNAGHTMIGEQLDRKLALFSNLEKSVKRTEEREKSGTISLKVLGQVAAALDIQYTDLFRKTGRLRRG